MNNTKQLIINYKDMILDKRFLTDEMINKLFNIDDKFLRDLSNAANEITRVFHGSKIDVEQLANIKKIIAVKIVHFVANLHFLILVLTNIN